MSEFKQKEEIEEITNSLGGSGISRKDFLKYSGAAGAAVATLGLVGCADEEGIVGPGPEPEPGAVNLGTGDVGILNYAYALEQLEAGFYIQVLDTPYGGMTEAEGQLFTDIRDHEVAHAAFYNAAIPEDARIPGLTPAFEEAGIDFSSRDSVVGTALAFENLGVSAYNGAGAAITAQNAAFLVVAGKIVSVEARHTAAISDIALPTSVGVAQDQIFGTSIINDFGLDLAFSFEQVLQIAGGFIEDDIDASGLPPQDYLN